MVENKQKNSNSLKEKNENCFKTICHINLKKKKLNQNSSKSTDSKGNKIYDGAHTENFNITNIKNNKLNTIGDFYSNSELAGNLNSNFNRKNTDYLPENSYGDVLEKADNFNFTEKINIINYDDNKMNIINNDEDSGDNNKNSKNNIKFNLDQNMSNYGNHYNQENFEVEQFTNRLTPSKNNNNDNEKDYQMSEDKMQIENTEPNKFNEIKNIKIQKKNKKKNRSLNNSNQENINCYPYQNPQETYFANENNFTQINNDNIKQVNNHKFPFADKENLPVQQESNIAAFTPPKKEANPQNTNINNNNNNPNESYSKYVPILQKYEKNIPLEYIPDIWKSLKSEENSDACKPHYDLIVQQTDVNFDMRAILIDWIIEVHKNYRLYPETLFISIAIIDRFLSNKIIQRTKLQLLGTTALFIASKYEEIIYPCLDEFSKITDDAYKKEEILDMEKEVLNELKYDITYPSPFRFFEIISLNYNFSEVEFYYGCFLMEFFLISPNFTKYYPSIIALAVVLLILRLKKYESYRDLYSLTDPENQKLIKECAREIYEFPNKCQQFNLNSVMNKYSSQNYHCVAIYQLENPILEVNNVN